MYARFDDWVLQLNKIMELKTMFEIKTSNSFFQRKQMSPHHIFSVFLLLWP